jgi:nicotinamide phosphoribosyltransferase
LSSDGINDVLSLAVSSGYSAENLVFGMGGGLLQKLNRDTNRFAYKSSAQCRNGIWHDVFKNPLDPSKASKKGKLKLVKNGDSYITVPLDMVTDNPNLLQTVYENGEILISPTFAEIRKRASL